MISTRRFPIRRMAAAAWLVLAALPPTVRAQAEFPTDRNSPEAVQLVETYRALAADDPSLSAPVEAFLFPLTRELPAAEPAEEEAPPEPPAPAEAKTMFFIRTPGGGLTAVRAESFEKDDDVLIIETTTGSKAIHQSSNVAGGLPWYPDADLASGAVDIEALATQYEAIAVRAPTLRKFLEAEAARFRGFVEKEAPAAEDEGEDMRERVAEVIAEKFEPAAGLSAAAIASRLDAAEQAIDEYPQAAPEIDEWAAPFREHLAHLLAGDEWTGEKWVTAAERREREERERTEQFRKSLAYSIGSEVVPGAVVRGVVLTPMWIAAGLVVVSLFVLGFLRGPMIRLAAVAVFVAVPLGIAFVFFLASRDAAETPRVPTTANERAVVDLIVAANNGDTAVVALSQDDINAFLARRFRVAGGDGDGLSRRALTVRLSPGEVAVFELVRGFGFDWIVRFDFAWLVENGAPSLEPTDVWIGRLPCPSALADALVANVESELGGALTQTAGLLRGYLPAPPEDGQVVLSPVAPAEAPKADPKPADADPS